MPTDGDAVRAPDGAAGIAVAWLTSASIFGSAALPASLALDLSPLTGTEPQNYIVSRYYFRETRLAFSRKGRSQMTDEPDYRALAELRHELRKFLMFSEAAARSAGIEPQQHQLLLAIKGLPEGLRPTVGALADRLRLRHHTVVGLLDRLVAAELAVRTASAVDGREILVRITARGERLLRELSVAHRMELEKAAPALLEVLETIVAKPAPRRAGGTNRRT